MRDSRAQPFTGVLLIITVLCGSPYAEADGREEVLLQGTFPDNSHVNDDHYRALKYDPRQWYGSTFFTGPDWTRVGKDWHHPGQNTPSVRCFVVPRDGSVTVTGRVFKLHQEGDGIRASIRHNDREVWRVEIDGNDGQGVEHRLELVVRKGDRIRFVVHKRVEITCDTTGWDPTIHFSDGISYRASDAFVEFEQGAMGWNYELDARSDQPIGLPTVYAWSPQLALLPLSLGPNSSREFTHREILPALVVADGSDQNGMALAAPLTGAWRLSLRMTAGGQLQLTWYLHDQTETSNFVWSGAYQGSWAKGWMLLDERLTGDGRFRLLSRQLSSRDVPGDLPLALRAMIQTDWRRQDAINASANSFRIAARKQLKQTEELLATLRARNGRLFLAKQSRQLSELRTVIEGATLEGAAFENAARDDSKRQGSTRRNSREQVSPVTRWLQVRRLKRHIALSNPLLSLDTLLVCKRVPPSWSHLVAQYFGWRQRPGGGLFVIDRPGYSLAARDILGDQLPDGSILEPRLSYDGRRILFAFVPCNGDVPDPASLSVNETGPDDRYFHLYEINVDGTGLRQITDGPYDDMMADYLPDGDIVFCSSRRRGYSRCFGPEYSYRWHTYTLHRMSADGSHIRALSYNDVSEWFPAVAHSGQILHARWDYIDRDAVTHQNLWSIRPDGTNPLTVWGNAAAKPHCTFQAKPIPDSNKIVFVASAHHSITGGPVCVLDPSIDTNDLSAVTRITDLPFPEAEGLLDEWYSAPWPLSEEFFLVAYSPFALRFQGEHTTDPNPDNALGIYVLDAAGNRELIYRDPDIGTTNPIPIMPRRRPAVVPPAELEENVQSTGTMIVTNVYKGLGNVPRGTIKRLRIVQILPKSTWLANQPRIGVAGEENGRAILGTVPVESDGSAYFEVPAGKPVLFQALDENAMAYQTMRSLTFVQPGEQTACIGCHEHRMTSPPLNRHALLALGRSPSQIEPGELGGRPFGFVEVVQPILDKHCVRCHGGDETDARPILTNTPHQGFTQSYVSLCGSPESWNSLTFEPTLANQHFVPRFVQRNQIQVTSPGGVFGARGSRLIQLLLNGHQDVQLTPNEIGRLAAWIDLNAIFYGVYDPVGQKQQLAGQRVGMPDLQ